MLPFQRTAQEQMELLRCRLRKGKVIIRKCRIYAGEKSAPLRRSNGFLEATDMVTVPALMGYQSQLRTSAMPVNSGGWLAGLTN